MRGLRARDVAAKTLRARAADLVSELSSSIRDKAGVCENVPSTRLPRPWSDVAGYDELMANWGRLDHDLLEETEDWAITEVFDLLIPEDVAAYDRSFLKNGASGLLPEGARANHAPVAERCFGAGRVVHARRDY